jgi:hypothetical protein
MPKLNFEKSIDIAGSPERVFDVLSNLASWRLALSHLGFASWQGQVHERISHPCHA